MEMRLSSALIERLDRCLVVEDDSIIRLDLEQTLRDFGFRHVHGASSLEAATAIIASSEIRFGLLDYTIGSSNSLGVADALAARGIPTLFLTAYGTAVELPPRLAHLQVLAKPFSTDLLAEALRRELGEPPARLPQPVCGCDCGG